MYEPTLGAPLNTNFVPEADSSLFPLVSIAGSQPNPSQTYAIISIEGSDASWSVPPPVEGLAAAGHVHNTSHQNIVSQDVSAHEVTTAGFPGVPFTVPAPTCGLAGGLHCTQPLDRSLKSIRLHLCMHGHKHPQKQTVQCPWIGCSDTLQWMNIPRHTLSTHLGARFRCSNCGKGYTREGGLARHTASLKCNGATYMVG